MCEHEALLHSNIRYKKEDVMPADTSTGHTAAAMHLLVFTTQTLQLMII